MNPVLQWKLRKALERELLGTLDPPESMAGREGGDDEQRPDLKGTAETVLEIEGHQQSCTVVVPTNKRAGMPLIGHRVVTSSESCVLLFVPKVRGRNNN